MNKKIKGIENLHILLWIGKDTSWVREWSWLAQWFFAAGLTTLAIHYLPTWWKAIFASK